MSIRITRQGSGYQAEVTTPQRGIWRTDRAFGRDELIQELYKLGCHQIDIGDAFYEADPEWLNNQR